MQVAVAEMAEHDMPDAGRDGRNGPVRSRHEFGHASDRNRDVMLGGLSFAHQGLGYPFAQAPEGFGLGDVLSDGRVESKFCFRCGDERILEPGVQGCVIIRVRSSTSTRPEDGPEGDAQHRRHGEARVLCRRPS